MHGIERSADQTPLTPTETDPGRQAVYHAVGAAAAGLSGYLAAHRVISLITGVPSPVPGRVEAINLAAPDAPLVFAYPPHRDCAACGPAARLPTMAIGTAGPAAVTTVTAASRVRLRPLCARRDGAGWVIGRIDTGEFVAVPEVSAELPVTTEETAEPISIRKLGRLEATNPPGFGGVKLN